MVPPVMLQAQCTSGWLLFQYMVVLVLAQLVCALK
jgi:hypothetical protein